MSQLCYFLIYRLRPGRKLRWNHPTGGLVMEPGRVIAGVPAADLKLASDVAEQRYHCEADEKLVLAEVFQRKEKKLAQRLHALWEEEMHAFLELMNST